LILPVLYQQNIDSGQELLILKIVSDVGRAEVKDGENMDSAWEEENCIRSSYS
jgi:hypothetical protein